MIWICSESVPDRTQHGSVLGSPALTGQHNPVAPARDQAQQLGSVQNTSNYHEITSAPGKRSSCYLRGFSRPKEDVFRKRQTETANVTFDGKKNRRMLLNDLPSSQEMTRLKKQTKTRINMTKNRDVKGPKQRLLVSDKIFVMLVYQRHQFRERYSPNLHTRRRI